MSEHEASAASTALLRAQYDNMLSCIRCGLCLSVCPTYQISFAEEEGPRGRIALARALTEGHLALTADLVYHEETCLLCEACTAICPAGVRMEPIGVSLRAVIATATPGGPRGRLLRWFVYRQLFSNMRLFRFLCGLARTYQRTGLQALARRSGVLGFLRLAAMERLLPTMTADFLEPAGQRWRPVGESAGEAGLFAGCIMSTAFAETDRATARVLAANGYAVVATAGQGCCGALHLHGGEVDMAKALARANIDAFGSLGQAPIIVNAAGCGSTLKGYGHLLEDDRDYAGRAAGFAARVRDVTEFLDALPAHPPARRVERRITLQEPCHLAHAQRIRQAPRRLLATIPGLELVEMEESALCCGSAGIYNVTQPEKSRTLLDRKLDRAIATGAEVIATANPGCQLQLQAGLRARGAAIEVRHVVDLLDEAYGGAEH